jgi:hypothetical protein
MKLNISFDVIEIQLLIYTTQTPIQWVPVDLSLGVKWPGRQAYEGEKTWIYTSTSPYAFMA